MWWLFGFYDLILPVIALYHLVNNVPLEETAARFILLGIVPFTNYQVTFSQLMIFIWFCLSLLITYKLYFRAQKVLNSVDPYRAISSQQVYLKLISL
jgi:hypothetical protein